MSVAELEAAEVQLEAPSGLWRDAWHRLIRNPGAIVGFAFVATFVIAAVFAPVLSRSDPYEQNLLLIANGCCPGPSGDHWFGVDLLGRDVFSRILYGARYSLLIGVVSVAIGFSVGMVLGAVAGYIGGLVDSVIMRLMDVMLAIPGLLLAIGIVAALGPGIRQIMVAVRSRRRCPPADDPLRSYLSERDLAGDRPGNVGYGDRNHRRRGARIPGTRLSGSGHA